MLSIQYSSTLFTWFEIWAYAALTECYLELPIYGLLIAKLHAYGLSMNACQLIVSYLKDRRQRVKVMGECSDWATVNRGVPQGSVMGTLLFNIFLNNLFYVKMNCEIMLMITISITLTIVI